jgi:outer membrane cobalamin receptor
MKLILHIALFFVVFYSYAQNDSIPPKIWQTSAEEMINQEVKANQLAISLATKTALSPEEAPSVISIISKEDIQKYAFRDIADALRTVPGFEFGIDVTGLVGVGYRGIWVHEGKYAIMIDGMPLNDLGYGNYNFFGSLPLTMVERIEIIRGSGSVLFGAFAEIATINVVTKSGEGIRGLELNTRIGAMGKGGFTRLVNLSGGTRTRDLEISLHAGFNGRPLSISQYQDFSGNVLNLEQKNADRRFSYFISKIKFKDIKIGLNLNNFDYFGEDGAVEIIPQFPNTASSEKLVNTIRNVNFEYSPKLSSKVTLNLVGEVINSNTATTARFSTSSISGTNNYLGGVHIGRYRGETSLNINLGKSGDLTLGSSYTYDDIRNTSIFAKPGLRASNNIDSTFRRNTYSWANFIQYLVKIGKFGLTGGFRYENTTFGNATAYRLGATYVYQQFNAKVLLGKSFRIPLGWQVYSLDLENNPDLKPENALSLELELGYKLNEKLQWRVNGFVINLNEPIVYQGDINTYTNFGRIENWGIESEINWKEKNYGAFINFSLNKPTQRSSENFVDLDDLRLLGLPPVKINLGGFWGLKNFSINPSITWLSERDGSDAALEDPNVEVEDIDYKAVTLLNINVNKTNIFKKMDLNFSIHNLLDVEYLLIQPYRGGHAPIRADNRNFNVGVKYKF